MDYSTLTMEQVEERLAAIDLEAEDADLDAVEQEINALEARKNAIIAEAEARAKELEDVAKGDITEPISKETKMSERTFTPESAEYRAAWLKNMLGRPLDEEERAAITATGVIPVIVENRIINKLKENKLLSMVDLTRFPGNVRIPNYSTNNDASWATTSTDSADVIDYVDLAAYQLIKTIEVPAQADRMHIDAFEDYLVEALSNKIETALQAAILVGTGSSQPTGIAVTVATASGTFTKAAATKADLLKIMAKLPDKYQNGAAWIMPAKVFYGEVMAVADTNTFVNLADGMDYRLFGKPVVLDDTCTISSTDTIFYGNPKAYHMNLGQDIEVAVDRSVGFRSNSAVYRAVCLADGKLDAAAAFVKFTRATQ
ncbi:MAG: phage major capsid protein [Firmicutes bacterium]|nr:phage major capsid protein [Bacillota bacterium]